MHVWLTRVRTPLLLIGSVAVAYLSREAPLWPAFVLMGVGEIIQLWATANLHKSVELAERGPYACMRNPMYVGRFLLGLGIVLLLDVRWYVLGPYVLGYCVYVQSRVLREEARLVPALGQPYLDYCQRIPRWLPRHLVPLKRLLSWDWAGVLRNRQHYGTIGVIVLALLVVARRLWL